MDIHQHPGLRGVWRACTAVVASAYGAVAYAADPSYAMVTFAFVRPLVAAAPTPVPTMAEWALVGLAVLLALVGAAVLWRRGRGVLVAALWSAAAVLGGWGGDAVLSPAVAGPNDQPVVVVPTSTTNEFGIPVAMFSLQSSGVPQGGLGNIFINNGAFSPSFVSQVFGSSLQGIAPGGIGFLGFGGGDGGVFGASTFSAIFNGSPYGMEIRGVSPFVSDGSSFLNPQEYGLSAEGGDETTGSITLRCRQGVQLPPGGSCALGIVDATPQT